MNRFSELEEHIQKFKKDEGYIEYFKNFAVKNIQSNPNYIKKLMEYLLEISKYMKYNVAEHWCLVYLGWYANIHSRFIEAIDLHAQANEFFKDKNNLQGMIITYNALLSDYSKLGELDLAIMNGLKGIELAQQIHDNNMIISLLINTADIYIERNDYLKAINLMDRLSSYKCELNASDKIAVYIIRTECELNLNNLEKAYDYCKTSLRIINENNYIIDKAEVLAIKAEIIYRLGNHEEAITIFEEVIKIFNKNNNEYLKIKTLIRWARCNTDNKEYVLAEEKFTEALKCLKSIDFILLKSKIYKELSYIYKNLSKYKEAFESLEELNKCQQIIHNTHNNIWITILNYNNVAQEAKAYKELYEKIDLISELGKKITSTLDIEKLIYIIYTEVGKLINTDILGIALYEKKDKLLNYNLFIENGEKKNLGTVKLDDTQCFGAYCFRNKKEIFINDIVSEHSKYVEKCDIKILKNSPISIIYIPIIIKNSVIGVLSVQSYQKNAYTVNDVNELKILASYISIALENGRLFNKIQYFARHDSLTGILNRNVILNKGKKILSLISKEYDKFSIIMIDIDYFKQINDKYGHNMGDIVLKDVTKIIKNEIRTIDFIGRYGGEEFLVLLPNIDLKNAKRISERIRNSVKKHKHYLGNGKFNSVTLSLGIYEFKQDEKNFFEGLKKADKALYMAKSLGRNLSIEYVE